MVPKNLIPCLTVVDSRQFICMDFFSSPHLCSFPAYAERLFFTGTKFVYSESIPKWKDGDFYRHKFQHTTTGLSAILPSNGASCLCSVVPTAVNLCLLAWFMFIKQWNSSGPIRNHSFFSLKMTPYSKQDTNMPFLGQMGSFDEVFMLPDMEIRF